jgi:hypothetical protein
VCGDGTDSPCITLGISRGRPESDVIYDSERDVGKRIRIKKKGEACTLALCIIHLSELKDACLLLIGLPLLRQQDYGTLMKTVFAFLGTPFMHVSSV